MALTSKEALYDYILRQLGAPLVSVEITEDQCYDIIDSTIQQYSNFALDGELTKYIQMSISAPCTITLDPAVQTVQKVSKGGGLGAFASYGGKGFVLDYYSLISGGINMQDAIGSTVLLSNQQAMMDKYFGDDLSFTFNPMKKKIEVSENYSGSILMEITTEYIPDKVDYIFDHSWVKRMAVARARVQQSVIVGKYDQSLLGGARINYDRMQQMGEAEIEMLNQELIEKWVGPAPILIG